MVIGSGMMATGFSRFRDDDTVVIFAIGVSDSSETSPQAFERERHVLAQTIARAPGKRFVYFSTCSIFDPDVSNSPYVQHKMEMEILIAGLSRNYLVFRLPQVVGLGGNRTNLVNYIHEKIRKEESFVVWSDAIRYVIDIDDAVNITEPLIYRNELSNRIVPVVSIQCKVLDIVRILEKVVGKKARYAEVAKGSYYAVGTDTLQDFGRKPEALFGEDYLEKTIRKYYGTGNAI